jgi:hypothetical protein
LFSAIRLNLQGCDAAKLTTFIFSQETHMPVEWNHDIDTTLSKAKAENRAVLMDFSSAPA